MFETSPTRGRAAGTWHDLLVDPACAADLRTEALSLPSLDLDGMALDTLEMLLSGAYSPLTAYMTQAEAACVEATQRLPDGTPWPAPVSLPVPSARAVEWLPGQRLALRDTEGVMLAVLTVGECWQAGDVSWRVAGSLQGLSLPRHPDFTGLRIQPAALRERFSRAGTAPVACFSALPLTRRQFGQALEFARAQQTGLLLLPVGGDPARKHSDFARIRSFLALAEAAPDAQVDLCLLPAFVPLPGSRGHLLEAIVANNLGCRRLLRFDEAREAEDGLDAWLADTGGVSLTCPPARELAPAGGATRCDSGGGEQSGEVPGLQAVCQRLGRGQPLPDDLYFPAVLAALQQAFPARHAQGFTVFFTGLSGAGKSTLARALAFSLMETANRPVTLLDGDEVRQHLSSELGFSRRHRDLNVRRIGFVASEITKHRGIAICAPIAPYAGTRAAVREMISAHGGFIEVHVSTPIETCEARDRKGLYAKARAGIIPEFTGVSDPYEAPDAPEIALDTTGMRIEDALSVLLGVLVREGYLPG
jgi:sulfate adenylyltransferase